MRPAVVLLSGVRGDLIGMADYDVAEDGTIVNIEDMAPQTGQGHCPARPVRYVLEMNQGWFSERGVKAGDRLDGPPFALQETM